MKVWVLGARGFIGRQVEQALQSAGHEVLSRPRIDMALSTEPSGWVPHLGGVDAVVNAVGVLRDSAKRPIWPTHAAGPIALFEACAQAGIRQVVQISALGINGNSGIYARSKRTADTHLLALAEAGRLQATVLRPSIVVGQGGASAGLFLTLARLPWLMLPAQVAAGQVQPLRVQDLAAAVAACLAQGVQGCLELAGPEVYTLQDLIAHWRQALGHSPARVLRMPAAAGRWSARLGDALPLTPWCSETLALLARPNTTDARTLQLLLGREGTSVRLWPQEEVPCAQASKP